ncbi:MAG: methylornithine synthase PylB [Candidatus Aminicenantes bacterium]|nr:methylornithine synthase PylB [Candidatus Aminicenantes bacterium]
MSDQNFSRVIEKLLEKTVCGVPLAEKEIVLLLELNEAEEISRVFQTARFLRDKNFGQKVFLYGFLYFSTFCRNDCRFCASRISNSLARRYRKTQDEIIEAACLLAESGVHLIDLTMGEDPLFYRDYAGFAPLTEMIHIIKKKTGLPIMVSPGVVPRNVLAQFKEAGADWFACYQETHNRRLFDHLRPHQDYDTRLSLKAAAKSMGMLIEEGIMTGVGETSSDIAHSTQVMHDLAVHQARAMSFVPQAGTPMSGLLSPPRLRELLTIAVLRLLFPGLLIPASLDVDGLDHVRERLNAGANVITSLIPPQLGLSGVSQPILGIDDGFRTVQGVVSLVEEAGLGTASPEEYQQWILSQKYGSSPESRICEVLA